MNITGVLANKCPNFNDCPRIIDTDGEDVISQGRKLTPELRAQLRMPDHEDAILQPRTLVYPAALTLPQLGVYLDGLHAHHRLRIENRRAYASVSDGGDFARYLDGAPEPLEGAAWRERLRGDTAAGKAWAKVHVVVGELSDYERYEFEWGFTRTTAAGEQVRIYEAQPGELDELPDFFVVEHQHVVRSTYSPGDRFVYAMPITGPDAGSYLTHARHLWNRAVDFHAWWAAHPEAHRRLHAA